MHAKENFFNKNNWIQSYTNMFNNTIATFLKKYFLLILK